MKWLYTRAFELESTGFSRKVIQGYPLSRTAAVSVYINV